MAASKVWKSVFFVCFSDVGREIVPRIPKRAPLPSLIRPEPTGWIADRQRNSWKLSPVATCSEGLEASVVHCLEINEPLSRKINRVPFAKERGTNSVCCKLLVAVAYRKYRDIYFQCRSFEIISGPSKKWVQLFGFSFCTPLRCKFCDSGSKGEVFKHSRDSI